MSRASSMMMRTTFATLAISLSAYNVSGSSSSSTVYSNTSNLTITGGSGNYNISWSQTSGGSTSISGSTSVQIYSSSLSPGGSVSGSWLVTVTDTTTGEIRTASLTFSLTRTVPSLSISLSGSGDKTMTSSSTITVTNNGVTINASGGYPPYSYSHTKLSGDFNLSGTSSQTCYASRDLGPQGGVSGSVQARVTDSNSNYQTQNYGVTLINNGTAPSNPDISASNTAPYGSSYGDLYVQTESITLSASGGTPPYSFSCSRISGIGTPSSSNSANLYFYQYMNTFSTEYGVFRCTVTDAASKTDYVDVTATFEAVWA